MRLMNRIDQAIRLDNGKIEIADVTHVWARRHPIYGCGEYGRAWVMCGVKRKRMKVRKSLLGVWDTY